MAGDLAELHLRHHRQSERRRAAPSRRLSERLRQRADLRAVAAQRLSVDAADVPLRRLDLYLGGDPGGRRARLPAPGRCRTGVRRDRRAQGDAHVRRAGGVGDADPRARGGAARLSADGADRHRRRRAAVRGDRPDGGDGLRRHPSVWADRKLRPLDRLHVAAAARRDGDRREVRLHGAPGGATRRCWRRRRCATRRRWRRCRRTARRWAS